MTVFSRRSHEGYLMVDHRASPGLPGKPKFEEKTTYGCPHCGNHVIINRLRTRERAYCARCDDTICDLCAEARLNPDYVHRSIKELADMIQSGKWELIGGTSTKPTLIKKD
jgi:predicted RNA-binding Zn-ribbon protein involved in translation (DUF1610 family)